MSYGYKLPSGKWGFRLSASQSDVEECARIRRIAIEKAKLLNGESSEKSATEALIQSYFDWQESMPADSENRKADSTLTENRREAKNLAKVFGLTPPAHISTAHIYQYLDIRSQKAPAKANKEIALLSAILEYGRRRGHLQFNPCKDIQYNKTKPRQKYVSQADIAYAVKEARERGGSYLTLALCAKTAYLTVSRPNEMRTLVRQSITNEGLKIPIGKRKSGQAQKAKLIQWSTELKSTVKDALALQRTASMHIFGNQSGQAYSRSGWTTIWTRLMKYCQEKAQKEGVVFTPFTLADMRPTAVTDRKDAGDSNILDATGHTSDRMVNIAYDRRKIKVARATK